jgi:hypothetical protein
MPPVGFELTIPASVPPQTYALDRAATGIGNTYVLTIIVRFLTHTYIYRDIDFFPMPEQPPVGQGLPIIEASRSHSDTPHSVGLLWTSDQPVAETPT